MTADNAYISFRLDMFSQIFENKICCVKLHVYFDDLLVRRFSRLHCMQVVHILDLFFIHKGYVIFITDLINQFEFSMHELL